MKWGGRFGGYLYGLNGMGEEKKRTIQCQKQRQTAEEEEGRGFLILTDEGVVASNYRTSNMVQGRGRELTKKKYGPSSKGQDYSHYSWIIK